MRDLIDTTDMYLRTVYELEEEGVPALRARLVERLHLSAPSVSETVARLADDGLLTIRTDRTLELTEPGRKHALSVMRKHRLAERLLTDVIGLDWPLVHSEACRWEHVISDEAERRLIHVLGSPEVDAHGNPIPREGDAAAQVTPPAFTLEAALAQGHTEMVIDRISEHLQADIQQMRRLDAHGLRPGTTVTARLDGDSVEIDHDGMTARFTAEAATLIFVDPVT